MDTSAVLTLLTGPGAALAIMLLGGRWLMQRIEAQDAERTALIARLESVIDRNTTALAELRSMIHREERPIRTVP